MSKASHFYFIDFILNFIMIHKYVLFGSKYQT